MVSQTASAVWVFILTIKNLFVIIKTQPIVYDALGNPTTYRGNTLIWTKISCLASYGSNTFEYNASGIRFKKNNTIYTLDGNKILKETDGTKTISYYYGVDGVVGFNYNGNDYYYRKNLQGDVIEIYRADGAKVANYIYDAWGKVIECFNANSENIATLNPFRYRSYYYDTETNLYYLESRYYDPETGRFISADDTSYLDPESINGLNLYAYCLNNPIRLSDPTGSMPFLIALGLAFLIGATIGAITGATLSAATYAMTTEEDDFDRNEFWAETLSGAVSGAITGGVAGVLSVTGASAGWVLGSYIVAGASGGMAGAIVKNTMLGNDFNTKETGFDIFNNTIWGGIGGAIGGSVEGKIPKVIAKAGKPLGKALNKAILKQIKKAPSSLLENAISEFTNWYSRFIIENTITRT